MGVFCLSSNGLKQGFSTQLRELTQGMYGVAGVMLLSIRPLRYESNLPARGYSRVFGTVRLDVFSHVIDIPD